MEQKPAHSKPEVIACEICLKEIPRDLAKSEEAKGYVHYFCGDACFVRWQTDEVSGTPPERGKR